jgi:hypothetical protein
VKDKPLSAIEKATAQNIPVNKVKERPDKRRHSVPDTVAQPPLPLRLAAPEASLNFLFTMLSRF